MIIRTICITPFAQNARIVIDEAASEAMVVDPGGDVPQIIEAIDSFGSSLEVKQIFLTHAHIDHAGGVEPLRAALIKRGGIRPILLAHPNERELRGSVSKQALMFGLSPSEFHDVSEPDVFVNDGDEVAVGSIRAKALFTPGHSPGHLSLFFSSPKALLEELSADGRSVVKQLAVSAPIVIGGDALFHGSIGRTDLPGGDYDTLIRSIETKLFPLPPKTVVLSGHGGNTTIGHEKATNPFFSPELSRLMR